MTTFSNYGHVATESNCAYTVNNGEYLVVAGGGGGYFNTGGGAGGWASASDRVFISPMANGPTLSPYPLRLLPEAIKQRCKYCTRLNGTEDEKCDGCGAPL